VTRFVLRDNNCRRYRHAPLVQGFGFSRMELAVADAAHETSLRSAISFSSINATITWVTEALQHQGYQTYTGTQVGELGYFTVQFGPDDDAYFS
jgi:hypothetical protein